MRSSFSTAPTSEPECLTDHLCLRSVCTLPNTRPHRAKRVPRGWRPVCERTFQHDCDDLCNTECLDSFIDGLVTLSSAHAAPHPTLPARASDAQLRIRQLRMEIRASPVEEERRQLKHELWRVQKLRQASLADDEATKYENLKHYRASRNGFKYPGSLNGVADRSQWPQLLLDHHTARLQPPSEEEHARWKSTVAALHCQLAISSEEVKDALQTLPKGKTHGTDGLVAENVLQIHLNGRELGIAVEQYFYRRAPQQIVAP
eukprot:6463881-Amphidinium_carterae.1